MPTSVVSVVYFLMAALLGAVGQLLYKSGAERASGTAGSYLINPRLWAGAACYVAVMVLFVAAFRKGGALSVLYPLYATTFVWAALLAWRVYGEPIRPTQIAGMLLLVVGLFLMGRGS